MSLPSNTKNNLTSNSSLTQTDNSVNTSEGLATNIADVFFQKGVINGDQLKAVKFKAIQNSSTIEQELLNENLVNERQLYEQKAELYKIPYVKLEEQRITIDSLNTITQEVAKQNMAIVFESGLNYVKVAMADPLDLEKIRFLSTLINKRIDTYFAEPSVIQSIIDTKYGAQIGTEVTEALEDVGEVVDVSGSIAQSESIQGDITSAPVSRIVNMILEYAVRYKASDVHIEPREKGIFVRYRLNGVMTEKLNLPKKLAASIVSRIKILSNLKIDEHRVPQDGRFQIQVDKSLIDLRVSVVPSVYGEKIVIRLLEKGGGTLTLEETGMRGHTLQLFLEVIKKTQGIILVTGPTGSGKTQTLASSLKVLNKPEVNIITIEDPVEIRVDGITQVQANPDVGLTFAKGLRSFLRQDPDIIMVGEIRDKETAELAVQASLTGHLVLSTLHTNSAAGAIPRLIDMGIEPFLITSTLNLAIAQRLVRKVCDHCRYGYKASAIELEQLKKVLTTIAGFNYDSFLQKNNGAVTLFKGKGCPQCNDSGFKGRIGIFEGYKISEKISAMALSHDSSQNIEAQAISEGMITMLQDGYLKALEGITTIEEVLRVVF